MRTVVVVALLATAALRPLAGQQVSAPAPAPAAPVATTTAPPGPRVEPQPRSYEPKLITGRATEGNASSRGDTHTIRYTTLTLVLVVIILVLLIA
jgi:hypothetical protein